MSKNTTNAPPAAPHDTSRLRKILAPIISLLIIVGLLWGALYYFVLSNPAQEVAQPFENAFAQIGGSKCNSTGDGGHGPDSMLPLYSADYHIKQSKGDVEALLFRVAKANGFNLKKVTPGNEGFLAGTPSLYKGTTYFDESKSSPYSDLETGNIKIDIYIYTKGDYDPCTRKTIDTDIVYVGIGVILPERR